MNVYVERPDGRVVSVDPVFFVHWMRQRDGLVCADDITHDVRVTTHFVGVDLGCGRAPRPFLTEVFGVMDVPFHVPSRTRAEAVDVHDTLVRRLRVLGARGLLRRGP